MNLKDIDDSAYETWAEERDSCKPKRKFLSLKSGDAFCVSREWRDLRVRVLNFYGRKCMKCKETKGIIQVDHIKPKSLYPELILDFRNMQVLCYDCNHEKGQTTEDYRSRLDKFRFNIP